MAGRKRLIVLLSVLATVVIGTAAVEALGATLEVEVPHDLTEGEAIPITLRVVNVDAAKDLSFFRPFFGESIGNITVQVLKLEKAGERKVEFAFLREEHWAAYDDQHRVTLGPRKTASYTFSLARYFTVRTAGRYRIEVRLDKVEGAPASAEFSLLPRKVIEAREFREKHDGAGDVTTHKALLVGKDDGLFKLVYENSSRGFKGAMVLDESKDLKDFEILHLRRVMPPGLFHDQDYRLHRLKPPIAVTPRQQLFPVLDCSYVAVVYRKGDSLFLWTRGTYGPGPAQAPKNPDLLPDRFDPNTVIAANVKLAGGVTKLVGVDGKDGLAQVTYVEKDGKTRTIWADECGKENGP